MFASLRKTIASLASARHRRAEGLFVAEGSKCVLDTLGAFRLRHLLATDEWFAVHLEQASLPQAETVRHTDLERMSSLSTPPPVLAVYELPEAPGAPDIDDGELVLALDCVQDPGNLGTIVRVADWMGVTRIVASPDTADIFGAKAVQATMGAVARVAVHYAPLAPLLAGVRAACPVYGTFLDGENIYTTGLTAGGVLVMGNEGRGISPQVAACVTRRITIPSWPEGRPTSESLNVGTATAIALAQFRSRMFQTHINI